MLLQLALAVVTSPTFSVPCSFVGPNTVLALHIHACPSSQHHALWVLACCSCTAALGSKRAWHHVDIIGSGGQQLGRLRLGLRVAKPIDRLLLQQQQQRQAAGAAVEPEAAAGQQLGLGSDSALVLQQAAEQVCLSSLHVTSYARDH